MKSKTYRILDANINRISEGLRVLEDVARFEFEDSGLTEKLKHMRHRVRKAVHELGFSFIGQRDSLNDPGVIISEKTRLDQKDSYSDLVAANFKRVQEGLRVVEETLKISGFYDISKVYESLRFNVYTVEKEYYGILGEFRRKSILASDFYCLTSEAHSKGKTNIQVIREMLAAGIKIIQYREKEKSMLEKYNECLAIRALAKEAGAKFIVNDHVDLAMMTDADGVHIGQDDLPVREVRKLVGEKMAIGISTHSPEQAEEAVRNGADYIGVGPIFKTYTKKDVCDPVGFEYLDYVVKHISLPFVAIGGIKESNIRQVKDHGATCIAMVTEIVEAGNISDKIAKLRTAAGFINA
ncbi:MAG: thiamine phosphate synthase [Proteobacteria bacterium]|nr:thiamine phosphate synthase [Pseudomonadota bacterium]